MLRSLTSVRICAITRKRMPALLRRSLSTSVSRMKFQLTRRARSALATSRVCKSLRAPDSRHTASSTTSSSRPDRSYSVVCALYSVLCVFVFQREISTLKY